MKIAIYNEFFGDNFAETELTERICLAAKNLGWEAIEVGSSIEFCLTKRRGNRENNCKCLLKR